MPRIIAIDDPTDPRLAPYRDLKDRALARHEASGSRGGLFVGETAVVVERMLARPGLTVSVLVATNRAPWAAALATGDVTVYVAPETVMSAVAGFPIHRGVLALGRRPVPQDLTLDAAVPGRRGQGHLTVLVCEGITDPENIGLLFRNAAAFAADAVVLCPRTHDPLYRRALRVAVGHTVAMPWARAKTWPGDLARLRDQWGLTLLGASTTPSATAVGSVKPPERLGLVVGAEGSGLSAAAVGECDDVVRVPMARGVDSLNVGVAAAVLLHRLGEGGGF